MIREKLAEKVKPAKEAGLVLIAIPTTKRKAGLKNQTWVSRTRSDPWISKVFGTFTTIQ